MTIALVLSLAVIVGALAFMHTRRKEDRRRDSIIFRAENLLRDATRSAKIGFVITSNHHGRHMTSILAGRKDPLIQRPIEIVILWHWSEKDYFMLRSPEDGPVTLEGEWENFREKAAGKIVGIMKDHLRPADTT